MSKKMWAILIVLFVWMLLVFSARAEAQHRYLGEDGARVFQCAKFYASLESQLLCVRGDELRAGQLDRLGMLDGLSSDRLVRPAGGGVGDIVGGIVGGNYGYNGGDGYFYHTDSIGHPMGTREKIVTGGAIGATLGAGVGAIFNRGGTGALLGAGGGAIIGAITSGKANKKAKEVIRLRQQEELSRQEEVRVETQARAEAAEAASKEEKLLRNRFDALVRLYFNSDERGIEEIVLGPGEITKIMLPRSSELIIAEVETEKGEWIRLEYGSGRIKLPRNSGWEFDPGSGS